MAVHPAPAVARIARLLDALAEAGGDELTLAELARRTGISKPTAHSLLLAMVDERFVDRREPLPTYRLGPALVALGNAARRDVTLVDAADLELERLRDRLQVSTMAGRPEGGEIVVLASRCVPHPFGFDVAPGRRVPFRPPVGGIYVAWSGDDAIRHWCDRAAPPLSGRRRAALLRGLAAVRRRGWSATIRGTAEDDAGAREATDDDLAQDGGLAVYGISAPVWDGHGRVACSLALVGIADPLGGGRVRQLAGEVVEAAARVTQRTT